MIRIGFADHLFLRMHHGIGYPVYNQFLWWFDESLQPADLEIFRNNLSNGLLARRLMNAMLPSARDRWVGSAVSHPLLFDSEPIESSAVKQWADSVIATDIDPETGLGWRLAATRVEGGGTAVALVASHMIADGGALIAAVRAANSAAVDRRIGSDQGLVASIASDVVDAAAQWRPVVSWAYRSALDLLPQSIGRASTAVTPPRTRPTRSAAVPDATAASVWKSPFVVAEFDAGQWNATAAKWGGTSNSLFVAVLTAASAAAGRAEIGDSLLWSLPVSDRTADDIRSNATKIVKIEVPVGAPTDLDLGPIRSATKAAFSHLAATLAAGKGPAGIPQPLIQMLPDAVVARVPAPRDGAEGLASNLGVLPDDFTTIAGVEARAVAGRATFAGADAEFARSLDGGMTAWLSHAGSTATLSVHAMDPDRFADDAVLQGHLSGALDRWGLSGRFW